MANEIDLQLLHDIVTPGDCPSEVSLPTWASLLANGIVLVIDPFLAVGLIASQLGVDVLRITCFSKVRLSAIIAASKRGVPEAVPALITLLGGEFVEGIVPETGKRGVVFRINPALANRFPAVRSLAAAGIGAIATKVGLAVFPPQILTAARAALELTFKQDPDPVTRKTALTASAQLGIGDPNAKPPSAVRNFLPWIITGVVAAGAGVFAFLARRHDQGQHDTLDPRS